MLVFLRTFPKNKDLVPQIGQCLLTFLSLLNKRLQNVLSQLALPNNTSNSGIKLKAFLVTHFSFLLVSLDAFKMFWAYYMYRTVLLAVASSLRRLMSRFAHFCSQSLHSTDFVYQRTISRFNEKNILIIYYLYVYLFNSTVDYVINLRDLEQIKRVKYNLDNCANTNKSHKRRERSTFVKPLTALNVAKFRTIKGLTLLIYRIK